MAEDGTTEIEAYVLSTNGQQDENGFNDAVTVEFNAFAGETFDFTFELVLDDYGSETTWEIRRLGDVVYSGGPYEDNQDGLVITIPLCLEEGCYILQVDDSYGDGMCCAFGEGSFTVYDPEGDIIYTGGEFSDSDLEQFCTNEMSVLETGGLHVSVWPNPAEEALNLSGIPEGALVQPFDALGRALAPPVRHATGSRTYDVADFPRGWMVLRITTDSGAYTKRCLLR
jgi:hypothetical protein